ncbi:hypothetical protein MKW94_007751 [Papaver nudicaule]|uniref:Dynamin-type G domain-containing protein n=1 Tax=Papaver nudicaule TaxID=74823 RepID=A0AA42AUB8_PAPNU|nr:hypothetical protein [Papaver nudicaule]
MGTRRPLILQMVHDDSATELRCRFLDSEEYGHPVSSASKIADIIKSRTEELLSKTKATVSSKTIVMRDEYAHSPNLTIIDTPGIIFKTKCEPEYTPDKILSMVKSLASQPHRLILFLQQSSIEWWEVDQYLGTSGYLGDNVHPDFVALPKDRGIVSNEEFRRQICKVDSDVLCHLREGVDEEKFAQFIGFGCLKEYLEAELQKRHRDSVPTTLTLLEQHWGTSDVAYLRRSAMMHAASISTHVWPGVMAGVKPPNSAIKLYSGAAFERVTHEFCCATYSIECPPVSIEKVANVLLAYGGHVGSGKVTEAAAEAACSAARSWIAPLLDTVCDRLAFVLRNLFDLAVERQSQLNKGNLDGYIGFHAALRHSYNCFVTDLCKPVQAANKASPRFSYKPLFPGLLENDLLGNYVQGGSSIYRRNQAQEPQVNIEENMPPETNAQQTTPEQNTASTDNLLEIQLISGDGKKKEHGKGGQLRGKRRHMKKATNTRNMDRTAHAGDDLSGNSDFGSGSGSAYSDVISTATKYFCRIREDLIESSVISALNAGFLTPCTEKLVVAIGINLLAVKDEKFMDMFVAPGAVDALQDERQLLHKRQKTLQSCLHEHGSIALTTALS